VGGRAWVMVAAMGATGCAGGAADSRGDGASLPAMTTSGDTSTGVMSSGTSSSGELGPTRPVPTTSDEPRARPRLDATAARVERRGHERQHRRAACGDGQLGADEVCDDGNAVDGDGCNADCQPSGRLLWSDSYGGGSVLADEALDCAVDEFGAIYVAGFTTVTKPNEDVWTRSWAPDGAVLWTQTYDGALGAKDRGQAVVVDASQLVYVAGHENVDLQSNDVWVRKHAADGTPTWTHGYNGPASTSDAAYGAALTAEGDLWSSGRTPSPVRGRTLWLRKLRRVRGGAVDADPRGRGRARRRRSGVSVGAAGTSTWSATRA
jgi:cysteine-rich repeat protein